MYSTAILLLSDNKPDHNRAGDSLRTGYRVVHQCFVIHIENSGHPLLYDCV